MMQATFLEQLKTLGNVFITNKYVFYISLIALGCILILELTNKFKNKKILKIICMSVYIIIFGILLYFFHEQIFTLIDYLMNNIFLFLFFPNLAVYTLITIIINIILIRSIVKDNKLLKRMNIIFFILFNIMFFLIIQNIVENNINIYEQLSIYTNKELLILISLSMKLFLLWLVILCIIKITNHLSLSFVYKKAPVKVNIREDIVSNEYNTIKVNDINDEIPKETSLIPNNIVLDKEDNEYVDIKPVNYYNDFINIEPVKKKKEVNLLTNMDSLFEDNNNPIDKKDLDVVFKNQYIKSIMDDIEKLKYNQSDKNQIKKVYDEIILNSKDLTLDDYNSLIHQLTEIKNNY